MRATTVLRDRARLGGSVQADQLPGHELVEASATPNQVELGDTIVLQMTVKCPSSFFGACEDQRMSISADGQAFLDRVTSFAENDPVTFTRTVAFDTPGTRRFQFRVGDTVEFHEVEVVEPAGLPPAPEPTPEPEPAPEPEPELGTHEIVAVRAPSTAQAGDFVELEMDVTCPSAIGCETQQATISAGDRTFLDRSVSFSGDVVTLSAFGQFFTPGESVTVQFRVGGAARTRTIDIQAAPTPEPEPVPGAIDVVDVAVSPPTPTVGQEATVSVAVENVGETPTARTIDIQAGGARIGTVDPGTLAGGATRTLTLPWTPSVAGTTTIAADGVTTSVTVQGGGAGAPPGAPFEVSPALLGGVGLLLFALLAR